MSSALADLVLLLSFVWAAAFLLWSDLPPPFRLLVNNWSFPPLIAIWRDLSEPQGQCNLKAFCYRLNDFHSCASRFASYTPKPKWTYRPLNLSVHSVLGYSDFKDSETSLIKLFFLVSAYALYVFSFRRHQLRSGKSSWWRARPRQPTEATGLVGFPWLNRVGRPTAAARQTPQAGSWLPAPCR